jgi:hypothetical protein
VDNILKILLGVLSVAGLIALVIPAKNPLPENLSAARAEMTAPPPQETRSSPLPVAMSVQYNAEPVGDFAIGAPTIDGNPMQPDFGLPFGASPEMSSANEDEGQSNQGGFTPPAYTLPGSRPQAEGGEQNNAEN